MWVGGMAVKLFAILTPALDVDIQVTFSIRLIYPGKNPQFGSRGDMNDEKKLIIPPLPGIKPRPPPCNQSLCSDSKSYVET
jgi:hypothetical protein